MLPINARMIRRLILNRITPSPTRTFCTSSVIKTSDCIKDLNLNDNHHVQFDPFTPYITPQEHRERQRKLVSLVHDDLIKQSTGAVVDGQAMKTGRKVSSLILVPSSTKVYQADTHIPLIHWKQNSNFIYLTGLNTRDACDCVLAIVGDSDGAGGTDGSRTILFTPHSTSHQTIWEGNGLMSSDNRSRINLLCDEVLDANTLQQFITGFTDSDSNRHLFTTASGLKLASNQQIKPGSGFNNSPVKNVSTFIDQLRLIKSDSEISAMKRAGHIGADALQRTIEWSKEQFTINEEKFSLPLVNESQISSKFDYESRVNGAMKGAYPTVCAGGQRSTTIHYGANDKFVSRSDWILMDAGCEDFEGYNSDITRCWPLSGDRNVSKLHSELYEALVEVQIGCIKKIESSRSISLDQLFTAMCSMLGKVLINFGAIPKSSSPQEAANKAFHFCPHHISHYLGLDVHDCGTVSRSIPLIPGMCFTVEPGLYFRPSDPTVKQEFKGIGIRVEDDLLIDHGSNLINLTKNCRQLN